jgi:phosphohistidine phosphatase
MKQLLIVRHAKSDRNDPSLADFDRPLNDRGHKNAVEMAKRLVKQDIIPGQLVSSPALRAISTANYFADKLGIDRSGIVKNRDIYEASAHTLLKVINGFDDDSDITALFGHNPGLSEIAFQLSDNAGLENLPTCGMALIEFPFDKWSMVSRGTGKLLLYDFPKSTLEY